MSRVHDIWHRLEIDDTGWTLSGHDGCPSFPDGPDPDDTGYGCPTGHTLDVYGLGFEGLNRLENGLYRIRLWEEISPVDGEKEDGMDVERIA